jgi:hypothetical protein
MPDPCNIDPSIKHIGIQSTSLNFIPLPSSSTNSLVDWADHGICGRGVLLDLVRHQTQAGKVPLPYDPWTTHGISVAELQECAHSQGVTFKRGDILLLRMGFIQKYYGATTEERDALGGKPETL